MSEERAPVGQDGTGDTVPSLLLWPGGELIWTFRPHPTWMLVGWLVSGPFAPVKPPCGKPTLASEGPSHVEAAAAAAALLAPCPAGRVGSFLVPLCHFQTFTPPTFVRTLLRGGTFLQLCHPFSSSPLTSPHWPRSLKPILEAVRTWPTAELHTPEFTAIFSEVNAPTDSRSSILPSRCPDLSPDGCLLRPSQTPPITVTLWIWSRVAAPGRFSTTSFPFSFRPTARSRFLAFLGGRDECRVQVRLIKPTLTRLSLSASASWM